MDRFAHVGTFALALAGCNILDRGPAAQDRPLPVEVVAISHEPLAARREMPGGLESPASIEVIARVDGRIAVLEVGLGDTVSPGTVVARLDDDELSAAVTAARADLAVARASLAGARTERTALDRDLERTRTLHAEGAVSVSALEDAGDRAMAGLAAVEGAQARVEHATAVLSTAQTRLGYAAVTATWAGADTRVVAAVHADEGDTLLADDPVVTVVDLDPLRAVVSVTERDYGRLSVDQPATVRTDAWPGETFPGRVSHIAPAFDEGSRQARVEVEVPNPDGRLKPGAFARVEVVLELAQGGTVVPGEALVVRDDVPGVWRVEQGVAHWVPVTVGVRDAGLVEVSADGLEGQVVTLGHQPLTEGARVQIVEGER